MKDVTYNGDGVLYEAGLRLTSGTTYTVTEKEADALAALEGVDISIKEPKKKGEHGQSAREQVSGDADGDAGGPGGSGPAEGASDATAGGTTAP